MNANNQSIIELGFALTQARADVAAGAAKTRPELSSDEMLKLRTAAYNAWVAFETKSTEVRT